MEKRVEKSTENQAHIQPERPMFHIPDIGMHAFLHKFQFPGFATESIYLGPARDARFYPMTNHILIDEPAIGRCMGRHVGTGSHHRHASEEDIDELRQFVYARTAHEVPKRELAGSSCVACMVSACSLMCMERNLSILKSFPSKPVLFCTKNTGPGL